MGHNNDATRATRKHLIQDAAIRPKIRFVRIKVTLERLRRHVRGRAAVQVGVLHRLVGLPVEQTRHRQQHLTIKVVGDMKHPTVHNGKDRRLYPERNFSNFGILTADLERNLG